MRGGPRVETVVGWMLGLVGFAYLLALPPTLNTADESFCLYGAKRVYQGEALYHDFFDFIMPGSFYVYALGYAVGGVSITSARVTTALLNALSVVCTYFLTLRVASMGEALIAGLLVVVICVPVWNMAGHHWIATAFGLATAAALLAPRWQDSSRARPAAAGALAGALVSTHQGRGVPLILWLVVAVVLLTVLRGGERRGRRCLAELVWTAVGGAAVCVPVFGYAVWRASLGEMVYATYTWVTTNYRTYNVGKIRWGGYGWIWAGSAKFTWLWLVNAIPTLLAVEGVGLLWGLWRHGMVAQRMRVAIFLLALAAVAGITYFPDVVHVAFVMPFALIVIAGMIHRVRTAFAWSDRPLARALAQVGCLAVLAVVIAKGWANARALHTQNPVRFETAFGTLAGTHVHAGIIQDLRDVLRVDPTRPPPRLYAHSTDAWIYLALPADNPTRYALLRPQYNTPEQIQETIDRLHLDRDAAVVVNLMSVKADDPVMVYLRAAWPPPVGIGPPVFVGTPLFQLFRRAIPE